MGYILGLGFLAAAFISYGQGEEITRFYELLKISALFFISGNLGLIYQKLKEKFG